MSDKVFILNIETSGHFCSVALSEGLEVLFSRRSEEKLSHNATLAPFVKEVLSDAGIAPSELSAVAASAGPGSYTGLRVGISLAKALCFGSDIPFIPVDTLQSLAEAAIRLDGGEGRYYANVDARRMEVYAAPFDSSGARLGPTAPLIITENTFEEDLRHGKVVFCGSGTQKCISLLSGAGVACYPIEPDAGLMISQSYRAFERKAFVDPLTFKPLYIKPPNITAPRKVTL